MPGRRASVLVLAVCLLLLAGKRVETPAPSKTDIQRQVRFGSEMAKQGNWREAIFRWQRALAAEPANPRLHNNLAVAYESLGEYARAEEEYRAALASPDAPGEVRDNHDLFLRFYGRYKEAAAESPAAEPSKPKDLDEKPH